MAVRQYVGARYVPKFYDFNGSPEWRSGVAYENLTIVTRNSNSYTSKKVVPSNIGEPENNPEYWVSTGIYNEQVEAYRQLTVSLSERVDDLDEEISDVNERIATTEGNVNTLQSDINAINNDLNLLEEENRRFIFVADSYGMRVRPSYVDVIKSNMGLSDSACYDLSSSGAGFSIPGNKFINILTSASNSISNHDTITDIVVGGGFNDANYIRNGTVSPSNIVNDISDFATYCKANYHNARLWLHFDAYCNNILGADSSIGTGGSINKFIGVCERLYAASGRLGYRYMSNVKYTLHKTTLLDNTYFHPNEEGNIFLATNIMSYLLGGDCSVSNSEPFTINFNSEITVVTDLIAIQEVHDSLATLSLIGDPFGATSYGVFDTTHAFNSLNDFELGTLDSNSLLFCGSKQFSGSVPIIFYNESTTPMFEYLNATIYLKNGKLYIGSFPTLSNPTRIFIGSTTLSMPTMGADLGANYQDA